MHILTTASNTTQNRDNNHNIFPTEVLSSKLIMFDWYLAHSVNLWSSLQQLLTPFPKVLKCTQTSGLFSAVFHVMHISRVPTGFPRMPSWLFCYTIFHSSPLNEFPVKLEFLWCNTCKSSSSQRENKTHVIRSVNIPNILLLPW